MYRWKLACINWPHPGAPHAMTYLNADEEAVGVRYHDTWADAVAWLNKNAKNLRPWAQFVATNRKESQPEGDL